MGGLLGGGTPTIPKQAAPPAPKQADEASTNAARAEMLRRRQAYGQEDTMLTGTLGQPSVKRKTLLGQ